MKLVNVQYEGKGNVPTIFLLPELRLSFILCGKNFQTSLLC